MTEETRGFQVRLPVALHAHLMAAARTQGEHASTIIRRAVEAELAHLTFQPEADRGLSGDPLLAFRFLATAPMPAVIKDREAAIVWANPAYADLVGHKSQELVGKSLGDLGLLSWEKADVLADIEAVLQDGRARFCVEPLTIGDRGRVLFGTHRWVFREKREQFLGDVSFDWAAVGPAEHHYSPEFLTRVNKSLVPNGRAGLFLRWLETCPTAIAIKDREGRIQIANIAYCDFAGRDLEELKDKTAQEIWNLPDSHPLLGSEQRVIRERVWMYAFETISEVGPRVSLRFPLLGAKGHADHFGVISTELGNQRHRGSYAPQAR